MSRLPLPLSLYQADHYVLGPALALLPARMDSPEARLMVHAIGLQEGRYAHRRQIRGPARGLYQFELGAISGTDGRRTWGLMHHAATRDLLQRVCERRRVAFKAESIYRALERDDVLAAACARLLLWSDPRALPTLGDEPGAWDLYIRTWRPGKPHRHTWPSLYQQALDYVRGKSCLSS